MKKKDFYYELPQELIAQHPVDKRDGSRLLVLDGNSGDISHLMFPDIKKYLKSGDCLVLNNTKVIPARIIGRRKSGTSAIEVLLLKRISVNEWETIVRPGRKMREGDGAVFLENELSCTVTKLKEDGNRIIKFEFEGIWEEVLERAGQIPLPPYIHEQLEGEGKQRYQTVYAKHPGSSAAPTAGLHFTNEMLEEIKNKGVNIAEITLHVGLGTFRPVKVENIKDHDMHTESYNISEEDAYTINNTKRNGGKIIAVGTTSSRVLESVADSDGFVHSCSGETNIFIYPGYSFKIIDALITNFHLPESTLIMLVSAFAGKENTLNAYAKAIEQKYRFYSFGDAMFIKGKDKK